MREMLLVLALAMAPASWQDQAPQTPAPPAPLPAVVQDLPAPLAKEAVVSLPSVADIQARRDHIGMMEGLLARAVGNGAAAVNRKVQEDTPGAVLMTTGQPRARGFVLPAYGVFFDVEIPDINGSVELTMQQLQREVARRVEQQVVAAPQRTATAQSLSALNDDDPNALYRKAVIVQCIDAMLEYSKGLNVQQNEWLTVALRGSEQPFVANEIRSSQTILLRIKGSDIADYLSGRITKDEAGKRVDIRGF